MTEKCKHCGHIHEARCPLIKSIEYFEDGRTIKRVEYMTPADYVTMPAYVPYPVPNPYPLYQPVPPVYQITIARTATGGSHSTLYDS